MLKSADFSDSSFALLMSSPVFAPPRAAYIHVPFCAHRCGYCDFTLVAGRDDLVPQYLEALRIELSSLTQPRDVDTLFLGGGTPTHLAAGQLDQLLTLLAAWFRPTAGAEFSVEANPYGLTREKVAILADHGVNRISLGVQSFDADLLKLLERDHSAPDIAAAVEVVRSRIENVSLDLIFGVPGQSLEVWRETLQRAVALEPAHVSTYGLTFERGTTFWSRRSKGTLQPVPEERERSMYAAAMDDLAAVGIEQYELSNFARPGFECRHNGVYWAGWPYFGFGPGAARYIGGRRETNHRSVTTWIHRVLTQVTAIADTEELDPESRARETLVLGLRRNAGVSRTVFAEQTGIALEDLAGDRLRRLVAQGLLEDTHTHIRLTREGRFVADSVTVELV